MDVREFNSELQGLQGWYSKKVVYFNKLSKLLKAVCGKEKFSSLWATTFFDQIRSIDSLEEQKFAWCVFYHVVPNLLLTADSLKAFKARAADAITRLEADVRTSRRVSDSQLDTGDAVQRAAFGIQKYIEICVSEAEKAFRSGGRRNAPSLMELQQFGKRGAAAFQIEVSLLPIPSPSSSSPDVQDGILVDCKMNTTVQECIMLVAKQLGVTQCSSFTLFVSSSKGAATMHTPAWYPLHPSLFMADVVSEQSRYLGLPPASPDHPPPALGIPFLFKAFVLPAGNLKGGASVTVAALLHRQQTADTASGMALPNAGSRCEYLPFRVDVMSVMDASQPVDLVAAGSPAILAISTQGLLLFAEPSGELLRCNVQEVVSLDVSRNKVSINLPRFQAVLECHPKHAQGMWTTWQAVLCHTGQIEELRAFGVGPPNASKQRTIKVNGRDGGPPSPSPPDTPPPGFLRTTSIPTPASNCSTPVSVSTPVARTPSCNSTASIRSNSQAARASSSGRWEAMSPEVTSASAEDREPYSPQHRYSRAELLDFKASCTAMPPLIDEGPYLRNYVESPSPSHAPSSPWSPNRALNTMRRSGSVNSSGRFSPSLPSSPMVGAPGLSPTNSNSGNLTPLDSMGNGFAAGLDPPPHLSAPPHAAQTNA